jgi:UDP-3-O-[3-hydroxymyristoyl] glucosamine N-acyltransferase
MPEGVFCAGFPVQSHTEWLRMQASMKKLPEMLKKIKQLEKQLAKYENK